MTSLPPLPPPPPPVDPRDNYGLVDTTLASRYRVDRVVARGGFGIVYAGHDLDLDRPVAIKVAVLPPSLTEAERQEAAAQFVREARTGARLKHPNIVLVLAVGSSVMPSGVTAPWMVLLRIEGPTLREELRARRARSEAPYLPPDAFALLRPVIDAVAHAHEEGYAHRDLKPANIMLEVTRRGVVPYVLDFGLAKPVPDDDVPGSGDTITVTLNVAFTPEYAAVEQFAQTRTGRWTDVHALGLIFTELLIGKQAYDSDNPTALVAWAAREPRPTPAYFSVDVGRLEPVLARALASEPAARFANARAFLDAIDAVVTPSPTIPVLVWSGSNSAPPRVPAEESAPLSTPVSQDRGERSRPSSVSPVSAPDRSAEVYHKNDTPPLLGRRVALGFGVLALVTLGAFLKQSAGVPTPATPYLPGPGALDASSPPPARTEQDLHQAHADASEDSPLPSFDVVPDAAPDATSTPSPPPPVPRASDPLSRAPRRDRHTSAGQTTLHSGTSGTVSADVPTPTPEPPTTQTRDVGRPDSSRGTGGALILNP